MYTIYVIRNNGKKFVWLDVKGVKDPLSYIKNNRLCPPLIEELNEPIIQVIGSPKTLTAAERLCDNTIKLLNPEYNG
jgi:hypothetical protein